MFDWLGDLLSGHPSQPVSAGRKTTSTGVPCSSIPRTQRADVCDSGLARLLFPAEQATSLFETNTAVHFSNCISVPRSSACHSKHQQSRSVVSARTTLALVRSLLKEVDTGITGEPRVSVAPEQTAQWTEASLIQADTFPLPGTRWPRTSSMTAISHHRPSGNPRAIQPTSGSRHSPADHRNTSDATALITAVVAVNSFLNSEPTFSILTL